MKKITLFSVVIFLMVPNYTLAEIFQIKTEITKIEKDEPLRNTCEELLEIQNLKNIVVKFIKGDRDKKKEFMSERFFNRIKEVSGLYPFMRESINRVEFEDINVKKTSALLKIQISWFSEGYDGVQTIYIDLVKKESSGWLIDWMVY